MVHRLLARWRDARNGDGPPTLDALYAQPLGDLLEHMVVVELGDAGTGPVIRLVGVAFRSNGCPDPSGRPVAAIPPASMLGRAVDHHLEVLRRGVPITRGGTFTDDAGRTVLYRSIILPVSETGQRISHLVCAANGKIAPAGVIADPARASAEPVEP